MSSDDRKVAMSDPTSKYDIEISLLTSSITLLEQTRVSVDASIEQAKVSLARLKTLQSMSDVGGEVLPFTEAILLRQVDELELTSRSRNCLKAENIFYIGDFIQKIEEDLFKITNLGRSGINEIKALLENHGLTLGMHVPHWQAYWELKRAEIREIG